MVPSHGLVPGVVVSCRTSKNTLLGGHRWDFSRQGCWYRDERCGTEKHSIRIFMSPVMIAFSRLHKELCKHSQEWLLDNAEESLCRHNHHDASAFGWVFDPKMQNDDDVSGLLGFCGYLHILFKLFALSSLSLPCLSMIPVP